MRESLFRPPPRQMNLSLPFSKNRFICSHMINSGCKLMKIWRVQTPTITYPAKKESSMSRASLILKTTSSISRWILIIKYSAEIIWSRKSLRISNSDLHKPPHLRQDNPRFVTRAIRIAILLSMGLQKAPLILGYRVIERTLISTSNLLIIYS